jgi:hypothetical protein
MEHFLSRWYWFRIGLDKTPMSCDLNHGTLLAGIGKRESSRFDNVTAAKARGEFPQQHRNGAHAKSSISRSGTHLSIVLSRPFVDHVESAWKRSWISTTRKGNDSTYQAWELLREEKELFRP